MTAMSLLHGLVVLALLQQADTTGQTGGTESVALHRGEAAFIPSGEFVMGSSQRDLTYAIQLCQLTSPRPCERMNFRSETPPHRVRTSAYWISIAEVDNERYEACVRAGACAPRTSHRPDPRFDAPGLPVVDVSYGDALAYCRWRLGRLPTEAEWERAARGPTPRRFPWGDLYNGALCNHGRATIPHHDDSDGYRYVAPVSAFPASRSPYGLLNMSGNVWEWVTDWYSSDAYEQGGFAANPTGPSAGQHRVIRGGSWATPPYAVRATVRGQAGEQERAIDIGFRCAWDER